MQAMFKVNPASLIRNSIPATYFGGMSKFEFCLPTTAEIVPAGADWFHEIKYDGYRLRIERVGNLVRLVTRGGHDRTKRYPWIAEAALKIGCRNFVIDGEAVILGVDGISDFNALHSRKHNTEVQLCAFDVLALDGEDLRGLPLSMRAAVARPARWYIHQPVRDRGPAAWDSRALSQSAAIGRIAEADLPTGSR
jgi:ATP-dependent DNA ligase